MTNDKKTDLFQKQLLFLKKIARRVVKGVELHLMLLPKNDQNTFDGDNGIIKSIYKMEAFQVLTAHGT